MILDTSVRFFLYILRGNKEYYFNCIIVLVCVWYIYVISLVLLQYVLCCLFYFCQHIDIYIYRNISVLLRWFIIFISLMGYMNYIHMISIDIHTSTVDDFYFYIRYFFYIVVVFIWMKRALTPIIPKDYGQFF